MLFRNPQDRPQSPRHGPAKFRSSAILSRRGGDDTLRRDRRSHEKRLARARRRRISHGTEMGHRRARAGLPKWSSAMPTRATRAPSWIAASWKAIRTACWKAWPSRVMRSGASEGYHLCPRRISAGRGAPENRDCARRNGTACSATTSAARSSVSDLESAWARARLSAARRRR